jgi:hypothetical protein
VVAAVDEIQAVLLVVLLLYPQLLVMRVGLVLLVLPFLMAAAAVVPPR